MLVWWSLSWLSCVRFNCIHCISFLWVCSWNGLRLCRSWQCSCGLYARLKSESFETIIITVWLTWRLFYITDFCRIFSYCTNSKCSSVVGAYNLNNTCQEKRNIGCIRYFHLNIICYAQIQTFFVLWSLFLLNVRKNQYNQSQDAVWKVQDVWVLKWCDWMLTVFTVEYAPQVLHTWKIIHGQSINAE